MEHRLAFYEMAIDYKDSSDGDRRYYKEIANRQFDYLEYIRRLYNYSLGIGLPNGLTPYDTFWMMKDDKRTIFAVSRLRHVLNEVSVKEGGHIGYDVPPSYRRQGFGTELLRLTLKEAALIGLKRVLVTCDFDNVGSAKIIIKNGGILENQMVSDYSGKLVNRYWIDIYNP